MTIVKRRKTSEYAQIHNHVLQEGLNDLGAIGLLAYIMSLPADWELHKTHLQQKFTRRTVDTAWKQLVEKGYAIGIYGWHKGKKVYIYQVSDIPFTEEEFQDFSNETITELQTTGDVFHKPTSLEGSPFKTKFQQETSLENETPKTPKNGSNVDGACIVQNVQYKMNCTESAPTKEIKTKEIFKKEKDILSNTLAIDNYQATDDKSSISVSKEKQATQHERNETSLVVTAEEIKKRIEQQLKADETLSNEDEAIQLLTDAANEQYAAFAIGRWNKEQWTNLITKFVMETIASKRYLNITYKKVNGYVYNAVKNMADHHDYKNSAEYKEYQQVMTSIESNVSPNLPTGMHNWLDERD